MALDNFLGFSHSANNAAFFQIFYTSIYDAKFWRQPWKQEVDAFDLNHGEVKLKKKKIYKDD